MDLAAGTAISANVRLVRPLGAGAMGSVWVGEDTTTRQNVAVKFLSGGRLGSEALARFQREASAAAQIDSPHVVRIHEQGVMPDGTPFIVMELLRGESLGHRLERVGRLPLRELRLVVDHVVRGLTAAHDKGIVHRDIKPDNIYLTRGPGGRLLAKVLDFGTAKRTEVSDDSGLTRPGQSVGTPEFMSPEQIMGGAQVDRRCDLWALGVVVYRALTGANPFAAPNVYALCFEICKARYTPVSRRGVPWSFDAWFERALSPKPEHRFQNAGELLAAFEEAVGRAEAPAPPGTERAIEPAPGSVTRPHQLQRALPSLLDDAHEDVSCQTALVDVGRLRGAPGEADDGPSEIDDDPTTSDSVIPAEPFSLEAGVPTAQRGGALAEGAAPPAAAFDHDDDAWDPDELDVGENGVAPADPLAVTLLSEHALPRGPRPPPAVAWRALDHPHRPPVSPPRAPVASDAMAVRSVPRPPLTSGEYPRGTAGDAAPQSVSSAALELPRNPSPALAERGAPRRLWAYLAAAGAVAAAGVFLVARTRGAPRAAEPVVAAASSSTPTAPSPPSPVTAAASVAPTASAAAPGPGLLTVVCLPICTGVLLDGKLLGSSPVRREPVAPGTHRVTLRRTGAQTQVIVVEVTAGEETVRYVSMPSQGSP